MKIVEKREIKNRRFNLGPIQLSIISKKDFVVAGAEVLCDFADFIAVGFELEGELGPPRFGLLLDEAILMLFLCIL